VTELYHNEDDESLFLHPERTANSAWLEKSLHQLFVCFSVSFIDDRVQVNRKSNPYMQVIISYFSFTALTMLRAHSLVQFFRDLYMYYGVEFCPTAETECIA